MNAEYSILTRHTQANPRTTAILAVAKANGLELDFVHTEPAKGVSDDYKKINKLGKVPTFEGADGYILSECMAIAIYSMSLSMFAAPACSGHPQRLLPCSDERSISNSYPCLKTIVENVFTL